jgi:DNA-binding NtrC family response regulator
VFGQRVLIVDDEPQLLDVLQTFLKSRGFEVIPGKSCAEAEALWQNARPDVAVLDYSLPDGNVSDLLPRLKALDPNIPIIVLTGYGSIDLAVEVVKKGAENFLTKPAELDTLLVMIQRCIENSRNRQNQIIQKTKRKKVGLDPFLGVSPAIRQLREVVSRVVETDSPVLIQGETGTGKGVLALWLHENSRRRAEPFVDLNCGGLSRELLETELFGHEKGAFTGAVQSKTGLLEIAHKGTVFLDEIGDVDPMVQPKLLKVLEDKQFRRLGDVRDRRVDIRLVAASHHDFHALVRQKIFRSDLYFRISTIPLTTPALRDRIEDIPILAEHLLDRLAEDLGIGSRIEITPGAVTKLQGYRWPGNIRELRNVLERTVLLSSSRRLTESELRFDGSDWIESPRQSSDTKTLDQVEREYIEQVLLSENGKVEAAAKKLGIPRSSLYQKLKQYRSNTGNAHAAHM